MSEAQTVPQPGSDKTNGCPTPPELKGVPTYDSEKIKEIKGKVSTHKLQEFDAALEKAKRNAADKYGESEQQAEEAKAKAEAAHTLADKKHDSAEKLLRTKISNANADLLSVYNQQETDSSGAQVPTHQQAILIAQLELDLADKRVEFQKEMQKIEQAKSLADADWEKAEDDYTFAMCVAKAEKEKAEKAAYVDYYKALSQALKD